MPPDATLPFSPDAAGDRIRKLLRQSAEISLDDGHQGEWAIAGNTATVRIEPGDRVEVWLPLPQPPPFAEALRANRGLPGNLRHATDVGRVGLLADTQLDGESHLPGTLMRIGAGLRRGLGISAEPLADDSPPDPEEWKAALADSGLEEDGLLEGDGGWELRCRAGGDAVVLLAAVEGDELRISREILTVPQETAAVVAHQALQFNRRLRYARLSLDRDILVAETRLHAGLLSPRWLTMALDAVAVAAHHAFLPLCLLAQQHEVAEYYRKLFLANPRRRSPR